jgi:hypothetical protein
LLFNSQFVVGAPHIAHRCIGISLLSGNNDFGFNQSPIRRGLRIRQALKDFRAVGGGLMQHRLIANPQLRCVVTGRACWNKRQTLQRFEALFHDIDVMVS